MKWILGMILPDPRGLAWYNPKSLIAAAIPDSVYEFAGLDPTTGNPPPDPSEMGPPVPEASAFAKGLDKTADWFSGLFKEDPALSLHGGGDLAFVGPPVPGGVVLNSGGNVTKEGDTTINVVGGDSSGDETRWRLFPRFRD
jgi:hypothetical protein